MHFLTNDFELAQMTFVQNYDPSSQGHTMQSLYEEGTSNVPT